METIANILLCIQNYVASLEWGYMLTILLICYGINHFRIRSKLDTFLLRHVRSRYIIMIVGLLYGIFIYRVRGYQLPQVETLFQSFVFIVVFHKLLLQSLFYWLAKHGLPESIAKHFCDEENLKKLYHEQVR